MNTPRWTDDDLTLMWQLGRDYQQNLLDEAADDLNHTITRPPSIPYEQRVRNRVIEMLRSAPADEYRGGPVDWDSPRRSVPDWLVASAARNREHDTRVLAACPPDPVWTTWEQVRAAVDETVWWRIWYDLAPSTRDQHPHLAPQLTLPIGGGV